MTDTAENGRTAGDRMEGQNTSTMREVVARQVVSVLLSTLLLGAAALKLADSSPSTMFSLPLFESPHWRMALIVVEAVLGLLLLLGIAQRLTWLATLVFFFGVSGASLVLGLRGEPSCGCLGSGLPVNPWYMLAVDLAAVGLLIWQHPHRWNQISVWYAIIPWGPLPIRLFAFFTLPVLVAIGSFHYSSQARALMWWLNDCRMVVEQPFVTVASDSPDKAVIARFVVRNVGKVPATIFGVETSCSCMTASNLPLTIQPNEQSELLFSVSARSAKITQHRYSAIPFSDIPLCPATLQIELTVRTSPP